MNTFCHQTCGISLADTTWFICSAWPTPSHPFRPSQSSFFSHWSPVLLDLHCSSLSNSACSSASVRPQTETDLRHPASQTIIAINSQNAFIYIYINIYIYIHICAKGSWQKECSSSEQWSHSSPRVSSASPPQTVRRQPSGAECHLWEPGVPPASIRGSLPLHHSPCPASPCIQGASTLCLLLNPPSACFSPCFSVFCLCGCWGNVVCQGMQICV